MREVHKRECEVELDICMSKDKRRDKKNLGQEIKKEAQKKEQIFIDVHREYQLVY